MVTYFVCPTTVFFLFFFVTYFVCPTTVIEHESKMRRCGDAAPQQSTNPDLRTARLRLRTKTLREGNEGPAAKDQGSTQGRKPPPCHQQRGWEGEVRMCRPKAGKTRYRQVPRERGGGRKAMGVPCSQGRGAVGRKSKRNDNTIPCCGVSGQIIYIAPRL